MLFYASWKGGHELNRITLKYLSVLCVLTGFILQTVWCLSKKKKKALKRKESIFQFSSSCFNILALLCQTELRQQGSSQRTAKGLILNLEPSSHFTVADKWPQLNNLGLLYYSHPLLAATSYSDGRVWVPWGPLLKVFHSSPNANEEQNQWIGVPTHSWPTTKTSQLACLVLTKLSNRCIIIIIVNDIWSFKPDRVCI